MFHITQLYWEYFISNRYMCFGDVKQIPQAVGTSIPPLGNRPHGQKFRVSYIPWRIRMVDWCWHDWGIYVDGGHGKPWSYGIHTYLVGGLVAIFCFPIYRECHHPNWLIFFRGVQTTNQIRIRHGYDHFARSHGWKSTWNFVLKEIRLEGRVWTLDSPEARKSRGFCCCHTPFIVVVFTTPVANQHIVHQNWGNISDWQDFSNIGGIAGLHQKNPELGGSQHRPFRFKSSDRFPYRSTPQQAIKIIKNGWLLMENPIQKIATNGWWYRGVPFEIEFFLSMPYIS